MLKILFVFTLFIGSISSRAESSFPAKYKTGDQEISTLQQFLDRIATSHPDAPSKLTSIENVSYKDELYKGIVLETSGKLGKYDVQQKLTYILLHETVYRLVFVEAQFCEMREVIREGKPTMVPICEKTPFPISKAFTDIFILIDGPVDLDHLSTVWQRKVELNTPRVSPPEIVSTIITRADMKQIMEHRGFTWTASQDDWRGTGGTKPPVPAIRFTIKGKTSRGMNLTQYFSYINEQNLLKLKKIGGTECKYNDTIKKDLCTEVFTPSSDAPFPMELQDSDRITVAVDFNPLKNSSPSEERPPSFRTQTCGGLSANFQMALRMHFEKGSLRVQDLIEYKNAFSRLPKALDPEKIFLDEQWTKNFLHKLQSKTENEWNAIKFQIDKGAEGDCRAVKSIVDEVHQQILSRSREWAQLKDVFINKEMALHNLEQESLPFSNWQKSVLAYLLRNPKVVPDLVASYDILVGRLDRYYRDTLVRASSYEETLLRAMTQLDAYSGLMALPPVSIDESVQEKSYFGLSLEAGLKGRYVFAVHPTIKQNHDLRVGDRLIRIRDKEASSLTYEQIDQLLSDTADPLELIVTRRNRTLRFRLEAKPLDIAKAMYKIKVHRAANAAVVEVEINSFIPGLSESLLQELRSTLTRVKATGFVINLINNQGGNADEALNVASFFVKEKVLTHYRLGMRDLVVPKKIEANPQFFINDQLPLVVLVNERTASSAEILAQSLQDLNRATLVGGKTFGKFVAQSFVPAPLADGRSFLLMVTSTEYFGPEGQARNGVGLTPDIVLTTKQGSVFQDGNGKAKSLKIDTSIGKYSSPLMSRSALELAEYAWILRKFK